MPQQATAPMTISFTLTEEASGVVERLAAGNGMAARDYLLDLLARALEDAEDTADAQAILARIERGEERVYSSDEVRKRLGLDD
jgi:RHH-type rel operon transcriptional repressor/antitoxin RelB